MEHSRVTGFARFVQITPCEKCRGKGYIIEHPCPECEGFGLSKEYKRIKANIPPGVEDGTSLRIRGEGNESLEGDYPGDLYIVINIEPHEIFYRQGSNLICEVPINFVQATLGNIIKISTIDGKAKLKIPPGTQSGTLFRLKKKGLPSMGHGKGDELVRIIVRTPVNLTQRQKQLIEELGKELTEN
jgi:molecular chaperone DnaJ